MDPYSSLHNSGSFIALICITLILCSLANVPTSAATCFHNSPHICKDYIDLDGNGVCDHDTDNKKYPPLTTTPKPTQIPDVYVNESKASDEITIDEEANQLYDPKTKTVFYLNNFGYVTTETQYSEEELNERWNEIMKDLGRDTAHEEQLETSDSTTTQREDDALDTVMSSIDDTYDSTTQSTENGDVFGNAPLQEGNVKEPSDTTKEEDEDTSLEMILKPTDENEKEEYTIEDENPLTGSSSLDLAGALTGVMTKDTSEESSEEQTASDKEKVDENGENKQKESLDLDNQAFFIRQEWKIDASSEDIISVLLDDPELAEKIQDQINRHIDIYETEYPYIDIDSIGTYDDETLSELLIDTIKEIGTNILKIPSSPLDFPEKVAKAIRDDVMGTNTLISSKGKEFLEETKKLEMQGVPYEEACDTVWNRMEKKFNATERYQFQILQDLIPREKDVNIMQYLKNSYKDVYEQVRRKDEDLVTYEYEQNAKIRAKLEFILKERINNLQEERGEK
jgi:hypothetical protein